MHWEYIFIHHSAGPDGVAKDTGTIRHQHVDINRWKAPGYHYIQENIDGYPEILIGRMIDQPGAHCPGWNKKAIGVCVVGNYEIDTPSLEQIVRLTELCTSLCKQFDIPPTNIHGHNQHKATLCPGKNLDIGRLIAAVTVGLVKDSA